MHLHLAKLIGVADLGLDMTSSSPNGIGVLVSRRLGKTGCYLFVVLIEAVPLVHGPGIEAISRDLSVLLMDPPDALHIVGNAGVKELIAGGMASLSSPLIVGAPEEIADLEETMIRTAISIQTTNGSCVEGGLMLGNAHPSGNLRHGQLVLVKQFLGQFATAVDFSLWLDLSHLVVVLSHRIAVDLNLLGFLVGGGHRESCAARTSTSCHIGGCILAAVGTVSLPGGETISADPQVLCIDLPHAQDIVGDIIVPQTGATQATTLSLTRW